MEQIINKPPWLISIENQLNTMKQKIISVEDNLTQLHTELEGVKDRQRKSDKNFQKQLKHQMLGIKSLRLKLNRQQQVDVGNLTQLFKQLSNDVEELKKYYKLVEEAYNLGYLSDKMQNLTLTMRRSPSVNHPRS